MAINLYQRIRSKKHSQQRHFLRAGIITLDEPKNFSQLGVQVVKISVTRKTLAVPSASLAITRLTRAKNNCMCHKREGGQKKPASLFDLRSSRVPRPRSRPVTCVIERFRTLAYYRTSAEMIPAGSIRLRSARLYPLFPLRRPSECCVEQLQTAHRPAVARSPGQRVVALRSGTGMSFRIRTCRGEKQHNGPRFAGVRLRKRNLLYLSGSSST